MSCHRSLVNSKAKVGVYPNWQKKPNYPLLRFFPLIRLSSLVFCLPLGIKVADSAKAEASQRVNLEWPM